MTSSISNTNIAQISDNVNTYDIKTYPELNNYCLVNHLDSPLVLCYRFKTINSKGDGIINRKEATTILKKRFNYKDSTVSRLLQKGNGIFWNVSKNKQWIVLVSIENICMKCNLSGLSRPVIIDTQHLKTKLQLRAELFTAFYKNDQYNKTIHPLTHKSIEEKTKVKIRRQQIYNKVAKVKSKPNYAKDVVEYHGKNKTYTCLRQLGNSYYTTLPKTFKGCSKNINKKLSCRGEAKALVKTPRYFTKPKDVIKGIIGDRFFIEEQNQELNVWSKC